MDDLEQKLKKYYDSLEIDDAFRQRLLALEHSPEAAPRRSRRRYVLPIAAAVAAAVALGSGWAYLRASMPGNAPPSDVPVVQEIPEGPGSAPAPSVKPAPPAPGASTAPAAQAPEVQTPEQQPVENTRPAPSAAADPTPADNPQSGADAPSTGETPEPSPADETPPSTPSVKPQRPTEPTPQQPADEQQPTVVPPQRPAVEPQPQAPDDPPQEPPVEPPPEPQKEDDPPAELPAVSAVYRSGGGQETVVLTNLSTGETVTVDVTGILPEKLPNSWAENENPAAAEAAGESTGGVYAGTAHAFGCQIVFFLTGRRDDAAAQVINILPD